MTATPAELRAASTKIEEFRKSAEFGLALRLYKEQIWAEFKEADTLEKLQKVHAEMNALDRLMESLQHVVNKHNKEIN